MDFGVNNEVETRIRVHKFCGCIESGKEKVGIFVEWGEGWMLTRLAFGVCEDFFVLETVELDWLCYCSCSMEKLD